MNRINTIARMRVINDELNKTMLIEFSYQDQAWRVFDEKNQKWLRLPSIFNGLENQLREIECELEEI